MRLTYGEWRSLVHGFVFGGGLLLSFAGLLIQLYRLRTRDLMLGLVGTFPPFFQSFGVEE